MLIRTWSVRIQSVTVDYNGLVTVTFNHEIDISETDLSEVTLQRKTGSNIQSYIGAFAQDFDLNADNSNTVYIPLNDGAKRWINHHANNDASFRFLITDNAFETTDGAQVRFPKTNTMTYIPAPPVPTVTITSDGRFV